MALVAYSDDSDLGSEVEDVEETEKCNINANKTETNVGVKTNIVTNSGSGHLVHSSIDDIVDVDDEDGSFVKNKPTSLLASIPAAVPVNLSDNDAGIGEDEDVLTDVPTVDTWKVTADIKKGANNTNSLTSSHSESSSTTAKKKEKKKVKIFIPALSEFDDDEEEEEKKEEPERKKIKASSKGTGLFSVLPEPKHISVKEAKRSLIPHVLTKPPPASKPTKPRPTVQTKPAFENNDSDDDKDGDTMDFFSLSESQPNIGTVAAIPIPEEKVEMLITSVHVNRFKGHDDHSVPENSRTNMYKEQVTSEDINYSHEAGSSDSFQDQESVSENPYNMDQEAMIRLMGKKRGKKEEINFINVNADDALLTRDEWMTKSLSEEKPSHSFSKKREGLPSQKQKQKHQITYLAHQAKERELELKNNWAQNRMTKMQTQAKYGF